MCIFAEKSIVFGCFHFVRLSNFYFVLVSLFICVILSHSLKQLIVVVVTDIILSLPKMGFFVMLDIKCSALKLPSLCHSEAINITINIDLFKLLLFNLQFSFSCTRFVFLLLDDSFLQVFQNRIRSFYSLDSGAHNINDISFFFSINFTCLFSCVKSV